MNLLQIVDLGKGQIDIAWRRGNDLPRHYPAVSFEDPLSARDRQELRWYLEQYLQFPYGAEEDHAHRVEGKMAEWGESLFLQVFPKLEAEPDPRGFYQEAVREGLEQCELCISSEDTEFLNIPWELIRDATPGRGYLAPLLGGVYRERSGQAIQAPLTPSADEPFRILLVIARPLGGEDVPLGTVARPILEAFRPLRPRVELEVLRPPTFEALVTRLEDRPGFYHLVHFDGHGVFAPPGGSAIMVYGAKGGRGHLVFEKDDGTADVINSEDLGQALATCKVPLFVLNACQSAEEGKADPFSSVAAQLVAIGAKGVVAMSYSVYADAAALFMGRFYEKLVGGASLSAAVAAGRKRLFAQPDRASVVGNLELRDWMVPALYQQEQGYVPIPERDLVAVAEEDTEEAVEQRKAEEVCPPGRFGFIGRDYDILRIERALRDENSPWVLLSGMGGVGKTELAFGFARWYAETGGCPGGIFGASFKEKADFGQVIGSIVGYGTDFSRLSEEDQWQYLVGYLRDNPSLLVWDNFETVAGYPQGSEPLATAEEQAALSKFLKALRGGKTRVLITTRKPQEEWLDIAPELVELGGLTERDAGLLAREILKTAGRKPEEFRQDPGYTELIKLLRGHPRSLEVVLPHLRRMSPAELIEAIQHRVDDLGESLEDASLSYAFRQLSETARRHLPLLGLFVSRVRITVLAGLTGLAVLAGEPAEVYVDTKGETLDAGAWKRVLDEAAACGLLRPTQPGVYELHPTMSPFLRGQLASVLGQEGRRRLDTHFLRFYAAAAVMSRQGLEKGHTGALAMARDEEGNFLRAVGLAEMNADWGALEQLMRMLGALYEALGRTDEWIAVRTRVLTTVGREPPDAADLRRAFLWMFLMGDETFFALERNDFSAAESAQRRVLDLVSPLDQVDDPELQENIAAAYHRWGNVLHASGELEQAGEWYEKAAAIQERLGFEDSTAHEYHYLGILALAHDQPDLEAAEEWHQKALAIFERLGLDPKAAAEYHHLGIIASRRGDFDQAEDWTRKALDVYKELGSETAIAYEYYQLSTIAEERGQPHEAEELSREALEILERYGLDREVGCIYRQLGRRIHSGGRLDEAEGWYTRALERFGRSRDPALIALTMADVGRIRYQQNKDLDALQWLGAALAMAVKYGPDPSVHVLPHLARLLQKMGEKEFSVAWNEAFEGEDPPLELLREVLKRLDDESS